MSFGIDFGIKIFQLYSNTACLCHYNSLERLLREGRKYEEMYCIEKEKSKGPYVLVPVYFFLCYKGNSLNMRQHILFYFGVLSAFSIYCFELHTAYIVFCRCLLSSLKIINPKFN